MMKKNSKTIKYSAFLKGMKNSIPIAFGYLAVSFSLGIAAKNAGLTAFEGFIASLLNNASAGEYAGFTVIKNNGAYWEIAIMVLIANARYFLMGTALSQRIDPNTKWYHRIFIGYDLTDELFGIAIAQPGFLNPLYYYGAMVLTIPAWGIGTALGIVAGNILPLTIVSALSVALYGMFLAVIIPPCRKNIKLIGIIAVAFGFSYAASVIPGISSLSEGTRIIILTIFISVIAALLFPIKDSKENSEERKVESNEDSNTTTEDEVVKNES